MDESVMLAFVTNSSYIFQLDSDDIIYLKDVGVSEVIIAAMIQHDKTLQSNLPNPTAAEPPPNTNVTVAVTEIQPPAPETVAYGEPVEQVNVSYTYFYSSLAPYGSWINVGSCGLVWRPTACAVNREWRPYCDSGRWVYSDCGWYWASTYSWGWAPYHYGRWLRHSHYGWCWAPKGTIPGSSSRLRVRPSPIAARAGAIRWSHRSRDVAPGCHAWS